MVKLKVLSFNCNGLQDNAKRRQIFHYLKRKKADIVLLQESHCTKKEENIWKTEWGGRGFFSNGTSNSKGVCTLFKNNFDFKLHNVKKDEEGRVLCLDIEIDETRFVLCNIYAPNEDDPTFFRDTCNIMEQFDNNTKIFAGLNCSITMYLAVQLITGTPLNGSQ